MIYRLLESGFAYDLMQKIVGGNNVRRYLAEKYVRPAAGQRILDIGCGPGSMLPYLAVAPGIEYVGIDSNPDYVQRARERYGSAGVFHCSSITQPVGSKLSAFHVAVGFGILHHLEDEETLSLFRLAFDALVPGGRLVTLDGCYRDGQHPMAYWMNRFDRGKNVRTLEEYTALANRVFARVEAFDYCGRLRFPLDHAVLVCEKPND